MRLKAGGYTLNNLSEINVIIGKNGYGKSRILRGIGKNLGTLQIEETPLQLGKVLLVAPERGGYLKYDPGIELSYAQNANYEIDTRVQNQTGNFRQQSMAKYRSLETLSLRDNINEYKASGTIDNAHFFENIVNDINELLDNIKIKGGDISFDIYNKVTDEQLNPEWISSGESELISLAIEVLTFAKQKVHDHLNILCLDEPDLHLHPDLQCKFADLLKKIADPQTIIILSSHNTPLIGALADSENTRVGFIKSPQDSYLGFESITEELTTILPIFGAHPLTNVYKKMPILLLEGEDDSRIWNTALRKSAGKINIYPCEVGTITKLNQYEDKANEILDTIYDEGLGYSLRDRDDVPETEDLQDKGKIVRLRLMCRNAENLLLTDEALSVMGTSWNEMKEKIDSWIANSGNSTHFQDVQNFKSSGYLRKTYNIKSFRNDILSMCGCEKGWEIVVGIAISRLSWNDSTDFSVEGSMLNFLGPKVVKNLLPKINP